MKKKKMNMPITTDLFTVRAKQVGLPPGSLIHVGKQKIERPIITVVDYDVERIETRQDISIEEARTFKETPSVSWINLSGIHDIALIEKFGHKFGIHNLALEDILNTQHRPKVEEMDGYVLIIVKMLFFDEQSQTIDSEQISLVLGPEYIITFQEREGDVFDGVRERLLRSNGRIRQRGTDYLAPDEDAHGFQHGLSRVRRSPGHDRDRAGHGRDRAQPRQGPN